MLLKTEDKEKLLTELSEYIDKHCIFRCNPEVVYSEGLPPGKIHSKLPVKKNSWQFMLRNLTHNNQMLSYVSALFLDDMMRKYDSGHERFFQLCGLETSSIPLMIGIQAYAARFGIGMNSFSIRKERKHEGLFQLIDGTPTEAPVIVVDDVFNSGSSIARCLDVCYYELGLSPAKSAYSIVKMRSHIENIKWNDQYIEAVTLFNSDHWNTNFDSTKYWLPKDCDKTVNKRIGYK